MVMPSGVPNVVNVTLQNHGNVDLTKLPKPDDTTDLYVQPFSAIYVSRLSVDAARSKCRELLEQADGARPGEKGRRTYDQGESS